MSKSLQRAFKDLQMMFKSLQLLRQAQLMAFITWRIGYLHKAGFLL
jgi:hypothetical protein